MIEGAPSVAKDESRVCGLSDKLVSLLELVGLPQATLFMEYPGVVNTYHWFV
jgi:hypothetical protein